MLTVIPFDLDNQKRCEPFILCISQAKTAFVCLRDSYFLSNPNIYLF
jgi:hypothetical protein